MKFPKVINDRDAADVEINRKTQRLPLNFR
jgi:hypothetical protein